MNTKMTTDAFPSETQLKDIMEAALNNQQTLNTNSYDQKWVANAQCGDFDYPLAAAFEIAEYGNSWNRWNWWSKTTVGPHELLNMKIELVDALHFIFSDILVKCNMNVATAANDAAVVLAQVQKTMPVFEDEKAENRFIRNQMKMLFMYGGSAQEHPLSATSFMALQALAAVYRLAIFGCGVGFRELSTMYFAKSELNKFRQDHGYREKGKYTKMWRPGLEDNHVMMEWISEQSQTPSLNEIRQFLAFEYSRVLEARLLAATPVQP